MFFFRHVLLSFVLMKSINGQVDLSKGAIDSKTLRAVRSDTTFQDPTCKCQTADCGCCTEVDIPPLGFKQNVCGKFAQTDKGVDFEYSFNNKRVLRNEVTAFSPMNPRPICGSVPNFPILRVCARFYDIEVANRTIRVCTDVELRLINQPLVVFQFDCVRAGTSGLSLEKPPSKPNSSQNHNRRPMYTSKVGGYKFR